MSDKPSSDNDTQNDFWDLDDDDLDLDMEAVGEKLEPEVAVDPAGPISIQDEEPKVTTTAENDQEIPPLDEPATTEAAPVKIKASGPKTSLFEKISIAAVLAALLGAAGWGVSAYLKHAPEGELVTFISDFPIQGEKVTVQEVETWWREPIRSGEDSDYGVVAEANLIPCARIKISDAGSTILHVTFRNGEQELIGDPTTLVINGGKFEKSGSDEIVIHSTSGFANPSRINAYTNGDVDPWSVVILEGNPEGVDADPLVKARIAAKYKEN